MYTHVFQPGTSPAAPVLLLLHGTGGDEKDLLSVGRSLLPSAHLLSPRGNVVEQGQLRFFKRSFTPDGRIQFDLPDLYRRTDELAEFVSTTLTQHGLSSAKVIALGFSNGANIAASLLLRHPKLLSAGVLWRPMYGFTPDVLPDLRGRRVLLTFGSADPITPPQDVQRLPALLTSAGATVESHVLPTGHGLVQEDLRLAEAFLSHPNG